MDYTATFEPTSEQLAKIESLARLGLTDCAIAGELITDLDSLDRMCGRKIAAARLHTNLTVLDTMRTMATSGKNYSATLFWIRTHCGSLWKLPEEKSAKQDPWNQNRPDKIEFTVYNNDGEPNYTD